jgi:hypothetical protein
MRCRELLRGMAFLALTLLLLTGCSPDCEWDAGVETWVDANENGIWDAGEPPLPDVKCSLESHNAVFATDAISNEQGRGHLHMMLAGCPNEVVVLIYVLPPPNYHLATESRTRAGENGERVFLFGFVPVNE